MTTAVMRTFTTGDRMDATAPTAQILASNATNATMQVSFSEPVSPATVDSQSIVLSTASGTGLSYYWIPVAATLTLSSDGLRVIVLPATALKSNWSYQLSASGIRDFAGNPSPGAGSAAIITTTSAPDITPPSVIITPPDTFPETATLRSPTAAVMRDLHVGRPSRACRQRRSRQPLSTSLLAP